MAEWTNMLERQKQLGLGKGGRPGLIYPIRFFDGESFPKEALSTKEDQDYTRFNSFPPGKAALRSRTYQQFEARVKELSLDLVKRLENVPPWSPDWPKVKSPTPFETKSLPFAQIGIP
jgi:hypothetical protein